MDEPTKRKSKWLSTLILLPYLFGLPLLAVMGLNISVGITAAIVLVVAFKLSRITALAGAAACLAALCHRRRAGASRLVPPALCLMLEILYLFFYSHYFQPFTGF